MQRNHLFSEHWLSDGPYVLRDRKQRSGADDRTEPFGEFLRGPGRTLFHHICQPQEERLQNHSHWRQSRNLHDECGLSLLDGSDDKQEVLPDLLQ